MTADKPEPDAEAHHRNWPDCPRCLSLMRQDEEGAVLNADLTVKNGRLEEVVFGLRAKLSAALKAKAQADERVRTLTEALSLARAELFGLLTESRVPERSRGGLEWRIKQIDAALSQAKNAGFTK